MLFVVLLAIFSSLNAESKYDGGTQTSSSDCILPPQPRNGQYTIFEPKITNPTPGDKVDNFNLEVHCNEGYHRNTSLGYKCKSGKYYNSMPECLPYCKTVRTGTISCGTGEQNQESKCLVQNDLFNSEEEAILEELFCGMSGLNYVPFISGGRFAFKDDMPWHAGIYTKKTTPYKQICGGSLVKDNVIISAAHCFWSDVDKQRPASDYAVAVGKIYRPWNDRHDEKAQKSDVAEIKIPPRFQGGASNFQDDIALVVVSTPFDINLDVHPVCLDFNLKLETEQLMPGHLGKVAGWGLTGENDKASPILKIVDLPYVSIKECIEDSEPSFKVYITSDKFCAGYRNGTAVCRGDSGGGLSFPESIDGLTRYFLRGVVSVAPRNDDLCNIYAWGTFTNVQRHESFIRETISGTDLSPLSRTIAQRATPF